MAEEARGAGEFVSSAALIDLALRDFWSSAKAAWACGQTQNMPRSTAPITAKALLTFNTSSIEPRSTSQVLFWSISARSLTKKKKWKSK
ncbi:hypothetical protein V5F77_12190 [Xanthobacter sp. DSM 24535]|uniref:hypothetical protein n=1 Tax=Roseixanthobacter psychrophilus TaxID=3119917 RepID=UPI003727AD90